MKFLDVLYVIILGIVEGITEWLPISSTGHIIFVERIFGFMVDESIYTDSFAEMFDVVIQLGAILAVVLIFFKKLWPFGFDKQEKIDPEFSNSLIEPNYVLEKKDKWVLWAKVIVGCIPAAVIGLLFDDKIDELFFNPLTISITLIFYGILFILIEWWNKKRQFKTLDVKSITFKYALIIGFIQCLAMIPGTSRSGVTILGAMLLLINRETAAEYSFFISIPVMFGASGLKLVKYLMESSITSSQIVLLVIGMVVSFVVSIFAVKLLMKLIKKHSFKGFGIYRICLGIVILICVILKVL